MSNVARRYGAFDQLPLLSFQGTTLPLDVWDGWKDCLTACLLGNKVQHYLPEEKPVLKYANGTDGNKRCGDPNPVVVSHIKICAEFRLLLSKTLSLQQLCMTDSSWQYHTILCITFRNSSIKREQLWNSSSYVNRCIFRRSVKGFY
nr:PREDICTED: protein ANKUB1 isoform X2 [Struthio camelus australis]XP_009664209.1 PREDICTED: protein ANKUB1 isoform X2 [Struthio camelus australis]